ncbi:MAG: ABC transporter ATP-binding protein [Bacteroidota bacterium]
MALLSVTGISKKQEKNSFSVKDVSFTQQSFQQIAIAGETGSGKTTLLKMIAGLIQPTAGEIQFEHKRIIGPNDQLIPGHPGIAYLSQHFELRNNYWVHEILEMANKLPDADARTIFSVCEVEHLLNRRTDQLSGGEKQRIALARLLISSPRLLLLDEPFSNLDAIHRHTIKSVIHRLGARLKITCILVSHDPLDILSWTDTILVMKNGEIIQQGTPQEIYRQPVNEYCAGLFGEYNLVDNNNSAFFNAIPGIQLNGKQLIMRPEHFHITHSSDGAVKAIVQRVLFWGSYFTLDVQIGLQLIRVKTVTNEFNAGDNIHLSFSAADTWYI